MKKKGFLLIISGHSGSGKDTLIKNILPKSSDFYYSISTTTRDKRDGEANGVDYHFTTKDDFNKRIIDGEFLEYAHIHGDNYYGTSISDINEKVQLGYIVILEIDTQGFMQVKSRYRGDMVSIFLSTPTLEVMKHRLIERGSESKESLSNRVNSAYKELPFIDSYDYLIINDKLDKTIEIFNDIINAVKHSTKAIDLDEFYIDWGIKE